MIARLRTTLKNALEVHFPVAIHRARVVKHIYLAHYEPEIEIVEKLVRPGTDAADVGANTGLFSWQIARYARRCYCFEPQPSLARYLGRALPRNCTVYAAAASDTRGTAEMQVPWSGKRFDESLAFLDARDTNAFARTQPITVNLETIDHVVTTEVSFINIDVEGHEVRTLRGALGVLRTWRPTLLVEIERRHNPGSFAQTTELLSGLGYSCFFYRDGRLHTADGFDFIRHQDLRRIGSPDYINNFLFLHKASPPPAL